MGTRAQARRIEPIVMRGVYELVEYVRWLRSSLWVTFLRTQFKHIGRNCVIHPSLSYRSPHKIVLEDGCLIKEGVILDGRSDRDVGILLGNRVTIRAYTYIDCYGEQGYVHFDDDSSMGQHIIIGGNGGVYIGKHTMISGLTYIVSATHNYQYGTGIPYRFQGETRRGVHIGSNVWIASHCMILDGVTVGDNAIIGAGSVVVEDIPEGCLAFGVPAKVRKRLERGLQGG